MSQISYYLINKKNKKIFKFLYQVLNQTQTLFFLKKNIFIGHPDFVYKKKVDVFIPTKTPGYDAKGLISSDQIMEAYLN